MRTGVRIDTQRDAVVQTIRKWMKEEKN